MPFKKDTEKESKKKKQGKLPRERQFRLEIEEISLS